jgi:hypothetical protein
LYKYFRFIFRIYCFRLLWLKKGSRDVFGTVLENNIYVLIDTSKSMEHHLGFVKEKLSLLIQVFINKIYFFILIINEFFFRINYLLKNVLIWFHLILQLIRGVIV